MTNMNQSRYDYLVIKIFLPVIVSSDSDVLHIYYLKHNANPKVNEYIRQ